MRVQVSHITAIAFFFLAICAGKASTQVVAGHFRQAGQSSCFIENNGQWPDSILYRAITNGNVVWFTKRAVHFQIAGKSQDRLTGFGRLAVMEPSNFPVIQLRHELVSQEYLGSKGPTSVEGTQEVHEQYNFFIGSDPSLWQTRVRGFGQIRFIDVWTGVDVVYYFKGVNIEYDIILKPGAARLCSFRLSGHDSLWVSESGDCNIAVKDVIIKHTAPVLSARESAFRNENPFFDIDTDGILSLCVPTSIPIVEEVRIDPEIVFVNFFGGDGGLAGYGLNAIDVDELGNSYVTGMTSSATFPVLNPYDSTFNGETDLFVAGFESSGSMSFCTYVGGSGYDDGDDIDVDSTGRVHVVGQTFSSDFPYLNGFDSTLDSPPGIVQGDATVLCLSNSGSELVYSSFLGGPRREYALSCVSDETGCLFITGGTESAQDFPQTAIVAPNSPQGKDCFLVKVSSSGSIVEFSSLIPGVGEELGLGIDIDTSGDAYVSGFTFGSVDFPLVNSFDSIAQDGELFVAKIDLDQREIVYSSLIGGEGQESGTRNNIDVDVDGAAYVVGYTSSPSSVESTWPFTDTIGLPLYPMENGMVIKIAPSGSLVEYSTLIGGMTQGMGVGTGIFSIRCTGTGSAMLTGFTNDSVGFPLVNALDSSYNGGYTDGIVAELSPNGSELLFSSYVGGHDQEYGLGVDVDAEQNIYIAGYIQPAGTQIVGLIENLDFQVNNNYFLMKIRKSISQCEQCIGTTGNVNMSLLETPDLSDLSYLVSYLTSIPRIELPCLVESNINALGIQPDLSDLSLLIAYLTQTPRPALPPCP